MLKYKGQTGKKLGCLIVFRFKRGLKVKERVRCCQMLYGYLDRSQYGRYRYKRDGFLKGIPYFSPLRGVLVIRGEDRGKVLSFLQGKVMMYTREIVLESGDLRVLAKSQFISKKELKKITSELLA